METCSLGIEEDILLKRICEEKKCVFNDDYPIYIYMLSGKQCAIYMQYIYNIYIIYIYNIYIIYIYTIYIYIYK